MKTLLKIIGVFVIPMSVSVLVGLILKGLGCDESTVSYWTGTYFGLSYMAYMYEVGFVKKGFTI